MRNFLILCLFLFTAACESPRYQPDQPDAVRGARVPLGGDCVVSQDCVGSYGQGRCVIHDQGATCVAAIFDADAQLMDYCTAVYPSGLPLACCASANLEGKPYSLVAGTDLTGRACDIGVFAPWE